MDLDDDELKATKILNGTDNKDIIIKKAKQNKKWTRL